MLLTLYQTKNRRFRNQQKWQVNGFGFTLCKGIIARPLSSQNDNQLNFTIVWSLFVALKGNVITVINFEKFYCLNSFKHMYMKKWNDFMPLCNLKVRVCISYLFSKLYIFRLINTNDMTNSYWQIFSFQKTCTIASFSRIIQKGVK